MLSIFKSGLWCAATVVTLAVIVESAFADDRSTSPIVLQAIQKGPPHAAQADILGHNVPAADWHGFAGGQKPLLFDPKTHTPIQSWEPLTHAFPLHVVRYHCGNKYPWKDTVGDIAGRKNVEHEQWKGKYRTEAGLDEFLQWVETLHQPTKASMIASPLRPVQEIADLVAYCNSESGPMAEWRAANGHARPYGIRYWELGNEVDWTGREDLNVMRDDTPLEKKNRLHVDEYIRECKLRIDAMRKVDPTIKIYAHSKTAPWFISNPRWPEWHQAVLRALGNDIDGIVIHPYYDGYPVPQVLRSVDQVIRDIHELGPKDRRLAVWVSEHSRWVNYEKLEERPQSWGLQGAISAGDFVLAMMERPEISVANYWCYAHYGPWRVLNANWEKGGDQKFGTGAYWLYMLLNRAYGPEFQALNVQNPKGDFIPGGYSYAVSAGKFRDPETGRTAIVAVNRAESQSFEISVQESVSLGSKVKRLVVTADSLRATNVPATPDAVKMTEDESWGRRADPNHILLSLPARSITAWIWE